MDLNANLKTKLDNMSYEQLLRLQRFAPLGDAHFQGESGKYILDRMFKLKQDGADHVQASKNIGW